MTDSAVTMIISKGRKRLGKFLFYGKTSKSGCKGEGQIKSFLLFRREIPRANKEGRYGRAACTYQHNRGGEEETRVRLKKREEEEKKEERSITPPWHRCQGRIITGLLTQQYRDIRRRGSPGSLFHCCFPLGTIFVSRAYPPLLRRFCLHPASKRSIFHYGNANQLIPRFSYQDFDVNGACWISRRRSMMKSPRLITALPIEYRGMLNVAARAV